ncbi:MAG: hypothetical protein WKG01_10535 [Kofleriaceae bacterium]
MSPTPRWTALGLVALVVEVSTDRRASPGSERVPSSPVASTCERYIDVGSNYPVLLCATGVAMVDTARSYVCTKDRDLHAPPCEAYVRAHPWFRDPL